MVDTEFDRWTQGLTTSMTRRGFGTIAAVSGLAGLPGLAPDAEARKKRKKKKKQGQPTSPPPPGTCLPAGTLFDGACDPAQCCSNGCTQDRVCGSRCTANYNGACAKDCDCVFGSVCLNNRCVVV